MKAVITVVIAAACLMGLGYYFSTATLRTGSGDTLNTDTLHTDMSHAVSTDPLTADERATLHAEKDGAQFQKSQPGDAAAEPSSDPQGNSISFEGSPLSSQDELAKRARELVKARRAKQNGDDSAILPLDDGSEIVGADHPVYSHESMKHKMAKAQAERQQDDLLIMEGRAEDRVVGASSSK